MNESEARGWRRIAGASKTFLTAMIALVAAAAGLLFQLVPQLKPDPRERVGADISIFAIEPAVPARVWFEQAFPNDDGTGKELAFGTKVPQQSQLDDLGTVVYVRTEVDGYKHRAVDIEVRLYAAGNHRRREFPPNTVKLRQATVDAPNRRSVQLLFLPDLSEEPPRFLRVLLTDSESGSILAMADSPTLVKGKIVPAATKP